MLFVHEECSAVCVIVVGAGQREAPHRRGSGCGELTERWWQLAAQAALRGLRNQLWAAEKHMRRR
ncbi:hypothetical protein ACSNOK_22005 [Streptomyces sp. URMC 126]|uniref:hypothetical protein n=1 Tax=Streptomyces sp. URMC 126 TaxID=3423401 RepID=UPI003F1CBBD1